MKNKAASNLGFKDYIIADATIAFNRVGFDGACYSAEEVHAITLANLHNEFSIVINTIDFIKLIPAGTSCE